MRWYRYDHTDKHGVRQYVKLEKLKIPNHKIYDVNKPEEREAYYYSLLLLFVLFTDESDLISEGQTAEEAFREFFSKLDTMEEHHENLQRMLKAQTKVKAINDARQEVVPVKDENDLDEDSVKLVGEAQSAMHNVHDMELNNPDTLTLQDRIDMLNEDQSRVFQHISDHLQHQPQRELELCTCKNDNPLHMFVSGVGGTGKSFPIETIRSQVKEIWKDDMDDDITCAVAAPTELAAYNVGGSDSTCTLFVPTSH